VRWPEDTSTKRIDPEPQETIIMTATLDPTARRILLTERLASLQAERAQAQAEVTPQLSGDDADRATNVDGHVRLAMLDERIATVESELSNATQRKTRDASDPVEVGDVVTVDFGDGPEDFLLGSVEQAGDGLDVITPGSPLGRALVGSTIGSTVEYQAGARRTLRASVVAAA
jgi:transcription elongation factor GreA